MTLAISGPSGTGKSTIVSIIKNCLATANPGLKVATIGGDSFFIGPKPDSYWTQAPKESPDSVDMIALRTAVAAATSDDAGNDLLLLEGFLLIQDAPLMLYVDAVLFLNCDPAVCLQRRLARSERSDHEAEGLKVYFAKHVWPGYLQHTAPAIAKLRATVAAAVIPDARPRLFEIDGTLPLDEVTTLAVNALPTSWTSASRARRTRSRRCSRAVRPSSRPRRVEDVCCGCRARRRLCVRAGASPAG